MSVEMTLAPGEFVPELDWATSRPAGRGKEGDLALAVFSHSEGLANGVEVNQVAVALVESRRSSLVVDDARRLAGVNLPEGVLERVPRTMQLVT